MANSTLLLLKRHECQNCFSEPRTISWSNFTHLSQSIEVIRNFAFIDEKYVAIIELREVNCFTALRREGFNMGPSNSSKRAVAPC